MKRLAVLTVFLGLMFIRNISAQAPSDTVVYLLTCGPGTATYSIYGHSALRIVINGGESDQVCNWGVFDFSTKHFAWKFAKGKLDYMLGISSFNRFMEEYSSEGRWVQSQRVNLSGPQKAVLIELINENLKPENRKYRYDFFYDNCATRIRDLLEKAGGEKLIYPPLPAEKRVPSFRQKIGEYQLRFPWLDFGIDLLIGTPGDKKAGFRDRMFLPLDLRNGLNELLLISGNKRIPLLSNPETILEATVPQPDPSPLSSPLVVFSLVLIIVIILSSVIRERIPNNIMDRIIFFIYSLLAVILIFTGFFSEHKQLHMNINIIWLSPFVIICLFSLFMEKPPVIWFRLVFFLSLVFLIISFFVPRATNNAFVPLVILLMVRSSVRAGFSWNPLSMSHLT